MASITDRYTLEIDVEGGTRGLNSASTAAAGLGGALRGIGPLAAGAVAALGGFAAVGAIRDRINDFDDLAKSARLAGAAAGEDAFRGFQVLQTAMAEAGIDAATFDRAMLQTTSRLQEGLEGGEAFAEIFQKLGDQVTTADGQLVDGATALQAMINALNEGTISTDEFAKVVGGRAGPLIQQQFASLNTDAETLAATLADVEANSNIVSLDAANNAEVFNDTVGRLGMAMEQLMTDAITPLLPMLVELAEGALEKLPAIVEGVQAAFTALEPVFSLIGTVLTDLVFPILGSVADVLGTLAGVIAPLVESAIPALRAGFEGLAAIVENIIGFFERTIEVMGGIGQKASELKDSIVGGFDDMKNSVVERATEIKDGVGDAFTGLWNYLWGSSVAKDIVESTKSGFSDMASSMIDSVAGAASSITSRFSEVYNSIRSGIGGAVEAGISRTRNLVGTFGDWFSETFGGVSETAEDTQAALESALNGEDVNGEGVATAAQNVLDLQDQIEAIQGPLDDYKQSLVEMGEETEKNTTLFRDFNEQYIEFEDQLARVNELQKTTNEQMAEMNRVLEEQNAFLETTNESYTLLNEQFELAKQGATDLALEIYGLGEEIDVVHSETLELMGANEEWINQIDSIITGLETTNTAIAAYVTSLEQMMTMTAANTSETERLTEALRNMERQAQQAKSAADAATSSLNAQAAAAQNAQNAQASSLPSGFASQGTPTNPIEDLFAGFFANGGFIPRGQFGVVGEQGPELVSGPAQVEPIQPQQTSVVYNINAVDAPSFQALIARDPGFIHAVAMKGAKGIVRSR